MATLNDGILAFYNDLRNQGLLVIEQWLGADSRAILNGDFRQPGLGCI